MAKKNYHGSCHCGAVKFKVKIDLDNGTTRCNCSICTKSRAWFTIVTPDDFDLQQGEANLADYSWNPPKQETSNLHYRFCKTCGVRAFVRGDQASLGGVFYAVAISALDNAEEDAEQLVNSINYVNGRHDEYEHEPADTRLM